jgi:hypothetical protein
MRSAIPKTLIVTGAHEPESSFGQKVIQDFQKKYALENIVYHTVLNNKGSRGYAEVDWEDEESQKENKVANKKAYAEIIRVIKKQNPSTLIDIHCRESEHERYRADIAAKNNSKLKHLTNATWGEAFAVGGRNGIIMVYEWGIKEFVIPNFIKFHPSMNYIGLETYLDKEHNYPSYDKEVRFTSELIKTIIECERS